MCYMFLSHPCFDLGFLRLTCLHAYVFLVCRCLSPHSFISFIHLCSTLSSITPWIGAITVTLTPILPHSLTVLLHSLLRLTFIDVSVTLMVALIVGLCVESCTMIVSSTGTMPANAGCVFYCYICSLMFLLSARQLKGSNTPWFTLPYAPRSLAACKHLLEQYESNWCWTQFYEYKIVAA